MNVLNLAIELEIDSTPALLWCASYHCSVVKVRVAPVGRRQSGEILPHSRALCQARHKSRCNAAAAASVSQISHSHAGLWFGLACSRWFAHGERQLMFSVYPAGPRLSIPLT
jgi:hypothetical protein